MEAPEVVEARLTITAPFCAGVVEIIGAAVEFAPVPPPFPARPPLLSPPPPNPQIKAVENRITVNTAESVCIVSPSRKLELKTCRILPI
jgi:hypothetical protein